MLLWDNTNSHKVEVSKDSVCYVSAPGRHFDPYQTPHEKAAVARIENWIANSYFS